MKKKIFVLAIVLVLCFALIFSLAACNGGNDENGDSSGSGGSINSGANSGNSSGSGDSSGSGSSSGSSSSDNSGNSGSSGGNDSVTDGDNGSNEVEEYIHILELVLNSFYAGNDDNYDDSESLATASAESSVQSSLAYPQEIFAILSGTENKIEAEEEGEGEFYKSLATAYLVELLAYCEAFHENYDTDNFYGVTIYQSSYINEGNGETVHDGYITVESVGNHRIAYIYGSTEDGDGECFYVFDVEFVDDNNFSVTMLTIAEIEGVLENVYYSYADTDGRFLFVADGVALYAEDEGCLFVLDEEVISDGWAALESEFDEIDLEAMRAYEGKKDYVITYEQYKAASDALEEKFA